MSDYVPIAKQDQDVKKATSDRISDVETNFAPTFTPDENAHSNGHHINQAESIGRASNVTQTTKSSRDTESSSQAPALHGLINSGSSVTVENLTINAANAVVCSGSVNNSGQGNTTSMTVCPSTDSIKQEQDVVKATSLGRTSNVKTNFAPPTTSHDNADSNDHQGEESRSGGNAHTSEHQHHSASAIHHHHYNVALNHASDGGQIKTSDQSNTNIMNVSFPIATTPTVQEESNLNDILQVVNQATISHSKIAIADKRKGLSEPEFQIHPQMREAKYFYDGNHISLHDKVEKTVTKKKFFGLIRETITKVHHNQIVRENSLDVSQRGNRNDDEVTMESLTEKIMKKRNLEIDQQCDVICLTASAGYGKTTCMRRLGRNILDRCGMNKRNNFISSHSSRYDMVRSIDFKDIKKEESTTLSKLLFRGCFHEDKDRSRAFEWVLEHQSRALLILDGFDQATWKIDESIDRKIEPYDEASTEVIIYNLLCRNLLPHLQIVMSSREFSVASLPEKARPANMISLTGFKEKDVKTLFVALLSSNGDKAWKKIEMASGLLRNLIQIPVYLILTAVIMARDMESDPPDSATQLIHKIFQILPHSSIVQEHKNLAAILKKLKILAHEGMVEGKVVFSHLDLERNSLTIELVRDVIIKISSNTLFNECLSEGDFWFYFCHQSLQEYLSARCISEMDLKDFREFRSEHLADARFSMVFQFLCGIIFDEDLVLADGVQHISNRKEKQDVLRQVLDTKLKDAREGYQKLEIYASLHETRNKQLVASIIKEIVLESTSLNRYGMQIVTWMISCRQMEKVWFSDCGIDDDVMSAFTEELRRMENKPQVEYFSIHENFIEVFFSNESLNHLLENLIVKRMELFDLEGKLKYRALDWKNVHQLDVVLEVLMEFIFINDQDPVRVISDADCCVTIEGVFHMKKNCLDLECDEGSSRVPSKFGEATNHLVRFFQPTVTVSQLKGQNPLKLIYFKDLKEIGQNTDTKIQLYDKGAVTSAHHHKNCKIYLSADIKSNDELSRCSTLVEQYQAENVAIHVKYDASLQDMQSFIEQCKEKNLVLVKHPPWNPSPTECDVKIVTYNANDHKWKGGEWKELQWISYWEDVNDVIASS